MALDIFKQSLTAAKGKSESNVIEKILGTGRDRTVTLHTLTYEQTTGRYLWTAASLPWDELPADAVHVSGKARDYFLSKDGWLDDDDPDVMTATFYKHWITSNVIQNAIKWKSKFEMPDLRTLIPLLVVGVVAIWFLTHMGGR